MQQNILKTLGKRLVQKAPLKSILSFFLETQKSFIGLYFEFFGLTLEDLLTTNKLNNQTMTTYQREILLHLSLCLYFSHQEKLVQIGTKSIDSFYNKSIETESQETFLYEIFLSLHNEAKFKIFFKQFFDQREAPFTLEQIMLSFKDLKKQETLNPLKMN